MLTVTYKSKHFIVQVCHKPSLTVARPPPLPLPASLAVPRRHLPRLPRLPRCHPPPSPLSCHSPRLAVTRRHSHPSPSLPSLALSHQTIMTESSDILTKDQLLFPTRDKTYYGLEAWYRALDDSHRVTPYPVWVVERITHHKYAWRRFQHELLMLQVAALDSTDQRRAYIAVGRTKRQPPGVSPPDLLSQIGIRGLADEVTVLAAPWSQPSVGLRSIFWEVDRRSPRLLYVSKVLLDVSCTMHTAVLQHSERTMLLVHKRKISHHPGNLSSDF
jgi:hypothetical protein